MNATRRQETYISCKGTKCSPTHAFELGVRIDMEFKRLFRPPESFVYDFDMAEYLVQRNPAHLPSGWAVAFYVTWPSIPKPPALIAFYTGLERG